MQDLGGHECNEPIGGLPPHLHDLFDERARGQRVLFGCHQEDGFDGANDQVGVGRLQFVSQIDGIPDAANDDAGAAVQDEIDGEARVVCDPDAGPAFHLLLDHFDPFGGGEQLAFFRILPDGDREITPRSTPEGTPEETRPCPRDSRRYDDGTPCDIPEEMEDNRQTVTVREDVVVRGPDTWVKAKEAYDRARAATTSTEARHWYMESLRLDPSNPAPHNALGLAHLLQGERDEARRRFRQALACDPNYYPALFNLKRMDTTGS